MLVPVYLVAGIVNLLAKNYNFNISKTTNPDIDLIRVKRQIQNHIEIPFTDAQDIVTEKESATNQDGDIPTLLEILQQRKSKRNQRKRDTYEQLTNENNDANTRNDQPYKFNGNNGYRGNYDSVANSSIPKSRFKTKPNIFVRTFNAISSSLGYGKTTIRPPTENVQRTYNNQNTYNPYNTNTRNSEHDSNFNSRNFNVPLPYKTNNNNGLYNTNFNNNPVPYNYNANNQINNSPYNNNGNNINGGDTNNNNNYYNSARSPYFNNGMNTPNVTINNGKDGVKRESNDSANVTEITYSGCILCSTFVCPEHQTRVGFTCQNINYDDNDY